MKEIIPDIRKRECPGCGKTLTHTNKYYCRQQVLAGALCRKCSNERQSEKFRKEAEQKRTDLAYTFKRTCSECGKILRYKSKASWRNSQKTNAKCKSCSKLGKRNPQSNQYSQKIEEERENMKDYCEICGTDNNLCYDHNHDTGSYRGTLCSHCNMALGLMKDDIKRLKTAAEYLEERV